MQPPRFIPWRDSDRSYLTLAVLLAVLLGMLIGTLYIVFTVVRVDGDSMAPVLLDEDRALVTKRYSNPRRGDIISLAMLDSGTSQGALKRVIGLPGDTVEVVGDVAYVNGQPSESAPDAVIGPDATLFEAIEVPEGAVYVLGDNRPVSLDSRFVGVIPLAQVQGKVVAIISPVTRFHVID
jgi:signal peptidase I